MLKANLTTPLLIAITVSIIGFSISLQKQTKKANKLEIENMAFRIEIKEAKKAEKMAKDSLVLGKKWMEDNTQFNQKIVAEIQGTTQDIWKKYKLTADSLRKYKAGYVYKYKLLKPKKGLFNKGYDTLNIN